MGKRSQKSRRHKRIESKNSDDEDDDEVVQQPCEEAGYKSFQEYNDAMIGKITEVRSEVETLKQTAERQRETIDQLKNKPEEKPQEKPEEKPQETQEDIFKKKASALFASFTAEEREEAEKAVKDMPPEIRKIAESSYEGRYALLKQLKPDAKETQTSSFFGDLIDIKPKSVTEQLADAMANFGKERKNLSPERKGSGFNKESSSEVRETTVTKRPTLSSLFE